MKTNEELIKQVEGDVEIMEWIKKLKQFNIDNAEIVKKKLIRECEIEIARIDDDIESAKERIKLYKEGGEENAKTK